MSPAQRIRQIGAFTVGIGSLAAAVAVFMRYNRYTFSGVWRWILVGLGLGHGGRLGDV